MSNDRPTAARDATDGAQWAAPERPEGVPETAQPVTVTLWVEPGRREDGCRHVWYPSGERTVWTPETFTLYGIPIPRPPRVGPLGLSEEDTRECAQHPFIRSGRMASWQKGSNAFIAACREAVAAWDAEDAS